jgi:hypothetical protein
MSILLMEGPLYLASGKIQQKTPLLTITLLFHDVTIGADPQRTSFPTLLPMVALRNMTHSTVASLFIVL